MVNQALNKTMEILNINVNDLASMLGVCSQAVRAWDKNGVPPKYCKTIELMTDGKVNRRELRDDWKLFWD